jgi:hypothetical protein
VDLCGSNAPGGKYAMGVSTVSFEHEDEHEHEDD